MYSWKSVLSVVVIVAVVVAMYQCMRKGHDPASTTGLETEKTTAVQTSQPEPHAQQAPDAPAGDQPAAVAAVAQTVAVVSISNAVVCGTAVTGDGVPMDVFTLALRPVTNTSGEAMQKTVAPDGDGRYAVSNVCPGRWELTASDRTQALPGTNMVLCAGANVLNLVFPRSHAAMVRGRAIIEKTGEPAPNVNLIYQRNEQGGSSKFRTDAGGRFSFPLIMPRGEGTLLVDELRFGRPRFCIGAGQTYREIVLVLQEAGTIRGHVRTGTGRAVAGANVVAVTMSVIDGSQASFVEHAYLDTGGLQCEYSGVTAEDGSYGIANVGAPGEYAVGVQAEGYRGRAVDSLERVLIDIEPGKTAACDFTLDIKPVVMLKVRDEQANPVLRYSLRLEEYMKTGFSYDNKRRLDVSLGADTWYMIPVTSDIKNVEMRIEALAVNEAYGSTNVTLSGEVATNFVMMTVAGVVPRVSGRVKDVAGQPLARENVYITSVPARERKDVVTDGNGGFSVFEIAGKDGDKAMVTVRGQTTNTTLGTRDFDWTIGEPRSNSVISGRVCLGSAATPVTNFVVKHYFAFESFNVEDGRFSMLAEESDYGRDIVVVADGCAPAVRKFGGKGDVDLGDIVLEANLATVMGRVVDTAGVPFSVPVSLKVADRSSIAFTRKTDGMFTFTDVPLGTGNVLLEGTDVGYGPFDIAAGATVNVPDFVLGASGSVIAVTFTFVLPDGTPARQAFVANLGYWNATDDRGEMIGLVKPGTYSDWGVWCDEHQYRANAFEITPTTTRISVLLSSLCRLQGRVTLDGNPLFEQPLIFTDRKGEEYVNMNRSDRFAIETDPGLFIVKALRIPAVILVNLHEGEDNVIDFKSAQGLLQATADGPGTWRVKLTAVIAGMRAKIGEIAAMAEKPAKFPGLPAGEYEVVAVCVNAGVTQQCVRNVRLNTDEQATVRIGGSESP